jgi:hypothetical protein
MMRTACSNPQISTWLGKSLEKMYLPENIDHDIAKKTSNFVPQDQSVRKRSVKSVRTYVLVMGEEGRSGLLSRSFWWRDLFSYTHARQSEAKIPRKPLHCFKIFGDFNVYA